MEENNIGSINEAGIINNFTKSGYTINHCLGELIANSIDALATDIRFIKSNNKVYMIDNGHGMNKKNIIHMFDLNRNNHDDEEKMGVSGIGGKIAQYILSKQTKVKLYTQQKNKAMYKIVCPWDEIYQTKKYKQMISFKICRNTIKNKLLKHNILTDTNILELYESGTIIEFIDNNIYEEIEKYISPFTYDVKNMVVSNMPQIIFGNRGNVNIYCGTTKLKKYNYFSPKYEFYEKIITFVDIYKDNNDYLYIFGDNTSKKILLY